MIRFRVAVLFVVSLIGTSVFAQAPAATSTTKHQKVVNLIKLTGTPEAMITVIREQIAMGKKTLPFPAKAQDDFETEFLKQIKVEDLIEMVVPAYEKYYTEAEIDQLTAFYQSPLGKKMVASMPTMQEEVGRAGAELGGKIGVRVGEKIGRVKSTCMTSFTNS